MSTPFAIVAARVGRISRGGAVVGILCGAVVYAAFFLAAFMVLGVALASTIAASRAAHSPYAQTLTGRHERRTAANIVANCGVGALAAMAELIDVGLRTELTALCCVTAIAAGASDTVASEVGRAFGTDPRSFPSMRPVPPGTPGAITAVGTLVGAAAALLIAAPAAVLWLIPATALPAVVVGCTVGAFVESLLATTLESRGVLGNHTLNAINTAVAAAIALNVALYGRP
jgi:uncharacterized protein (TIGR00297 family)